MTPQISVTMRRTSDNQLLPNETLAFKLNNVDIGTAVTNANGVAVLPYIPPTSVGVGSRTLKATYAATTNYKGQVASWSLTFIKTPTALATTAITGDRGTNVNLIATLTNKDTNALLEGKTVKFFVGGVLAGQSNTNASGVATLPYTLPNTAGKAYLVVVFDGNDFYANSSRQTTITTR